jgi:hypothetical protein
VLGIASRLGHFARFLAAYDPALTSLAALDRQRNIEPYLAAVGRRPQPAHRGGAVGLRAALAGADPRAAHR